jgi:hypothetical protein
MQRWGVFRGLSVSGVLALLHAAPDDAPDRRQVKAEVLGNRPAAAGAGRMRGRDGGVAVGRGGGDLRERGAGVRRRLCGTLRSSPRILDCCRARSTTASSPR